MKSHFFSSSSILKKFLVFNLIVFLFLGIVTFLYLNAIKPNLVKSHRHLSSLIEYKPDNSQISKVEELLKRSDIDTSDKSHLHYTYAKMKEDIGENEAAFENYVAGGALRKKLSN